MSITRWALAWIIFASLVVVMLSEGVFISKNSLKKLSEKGFYEITSNGHSYLLEYKQIDSNAFESILSNSEFKTASEVLEENAYLKRVIDLIISRMSEQEFVPREAFYPQSSSGFPLYIVWLAPQDRIHLIILQKCL